MAGRRIRGTALGLVASAMVLSGAVVPAPAAAGSSFVQHCKAPRATSGPLDDAVVESFVEDFKMTERTAKRWMRTVDRAEALIGAIEGKGSRSVPSSLAGSYYEAWFDNGKRQVHLAMSGRRFDRHVRACAAAMGIRDRSIVIDVMRWSPAQLDAAASQLGTALQGLAEADLYDVMRVSGTDVLVVSVFKTATDEQFAAVQAAAATLPVEARVERVSWVARDLIPTPD